MDVVQVTPANLQRVGLREPAEVIWWCGELGCSATELRRAVSAVGASADEVEKYIARFTA
jgi:hypothetical protein